MAERLIEANGVELCTESFGDPADPPVLLVMGIGASMLWWDDGLCRLFAGGGRFVVRYDHRDTGHSVSYPPGRPGYTGADLVTDAAGVLDAYDMKSAHVVGCSAGGAFAQLLALDHPNRVRSLVLISTTPATAGNRDLPPPTERVTRHVARARVDWSDANSVVEHLVAYGRVLAGPERPFDEAAMRQFARRDVARARDFAAMQNHEMLTDGERAVAPLSSITAPTLVVHGTADPLFPFEHAQAVVAEIPGARLLPLPGAGHGVERADWPAVVAAVIEHTA